MNTSQPSQKQINQALKSRARAAEMMSKADKLLAAKGLDHKQAELMQKRHPHDAKRSNVARKGPQTTPLKKKKNPGETRKASQNARPRFRRPATSPVVTLDKQIHEEYQKYLKRLDEKHKRMADSHAKVLGSVDRLVTEIKTQNNIIKNNQNVPNEIQQKPLGKKFSHLNVKEYGPLGPTHVVGTGVVTQSLIGKPPEEYDIPGGKGKRHYAFLGTVSVPAGTAPGTPIFMQKFNPGLFLNSLFYLDAQQYEKWKVVKACMVVSPLCSTSTDGALVGAFHCDPDDLETAFTGLEYATSHENAVQFNAWEATEICYPRKTPLLYTQTTDATEPRTADAGILVLWYAGGLAASNYDKVLWNVGIWADLHFVDQRLIPVGSFSGSPYANITNGTSILGDSECVGDIPKADLFQGGNVSFDDLGVTLNSDGTITVDFTNFAGYNLYAGLDFNTTNNDSITDYAKLVPGLTNFTILDEGTDLYPISPTPNNVSSWFGLLEPVAGFASGILDFGLSETASSLLVTGAELLVALVPALLRSTREVQVIYSKMPRLRGMNHFFLRQYKQCLPRDIVHTGKFASGFIAHTTGISFAASTSQLCLGDALGAQLYCYGMTCTLNGTTGNVSWNITATDVNSSAYMLIGHIMLKCTLGNAGLTCGLNWDVTGAWTNYIQEGYPSYTISSPGTNQVWSLGFFGSQDGNWFPTVPIAAGSGSLEPILTSSVTGACTFNFDMTFMVLPEAQALPLMKMIEADDSRAKFALKDTMKEIFSDGDRVEVSEERDLDAMIREYKRYLQKLKEKKTKGSLLSNA
jgi:hypothetical protein